jgi:hypothetical protein
MSESDPEECDLSEKSGQSKRQKTVNEYFKNYSFFNTVSVRVGSGLLSTVSVRVRFRKYY